MSGKAERKCYYYEHYPNDFYVQEYGMCYRNFIRMLPQIDNERYSRLFKTLSICLILIEDAFCDYVNYLKYIGVDIYDNMNDSDTAFSVKKHIEKSINIFLSRHGISPNKPNMFYEDSFLLISHECQNTQNAQINHLVGKTINGITIKKLSDIICYPHSYFECFENTIKETKKPKDAISIKLDYIVNTLDGKIKDTSFEYLVDLILRISQEIYNSANHKSRKGLELFIYVQHEVKNFLKGENLDLNLVPNIFYDECFLIVIYKIQEELESKKTGEKSFLNDKYKSLYDLTYNRFIVQLVKKEDNILNDSIQTITSFIGEHGSLEDAIGVCNWLDEFSKDFNTINVNDSALEVRNTIYSVFANKINSLMDRGYITKTNIPSEVLEAAFYRVSANIYCEMIDRLTNQIEKKEEGSGANNNISDNSPKNTNASISKTASYILATLSCIILFFIYQAVVVVVFGWKSGGGVFPMFILFSVLVWLWRWIVSFTKVK